MVDEVARLGIEVDSSDIKGSISDLERLEKQGKKTEGETKKSGQGMAVGFGYAKAGAIALAAAATAAAVASVKTAAKFETLTASLETVTGSAEGATAAMNMVKDMASDTPYSVQELTDSFIKLKAMGLDPSRASLMSYGNTASAMGKDLNQMIEAVADAATGEFERLKEFGIKASQEGDRVKFTFQGVTTEVGKNSKEIQDYLLSIGNVQFAGAMEKQMGTLNGVFSNLGDSIDNLFVAIGEAGLTDAVKSLAGGLQELVETATNLAKIWGDSPEDAYDPLKASAFAYREELEKNLLPAAARLREIIEADIPEAAKNIYRQQLANIEGGIAALEGAMGKVKSAQEEPLKSALSTPAPAAVEDPAIAGMPDQEEMDAAIDMIEAQFEQMRSLEALRIVDFQAYEAELTRISQEEAEKRMEIQHAIVANYASTANNVASIITDLGGKSKAAAMASLLLQKGAAAASVITNAEAAKFQAMASTPPTAWPGLISSIEVSRATSLAAIAASTIAGARGISKGGGGGSAGGGGANGGGSSIPGTQGDTEFAAPSRTLTINIPPDALISGRQLAEILRQAQEDGARV